MGFVGLILLIVGSSAAPKWRSVGNETENGASNSEVGVPRCITDTQRDARWRHVKSDRPGAQAFSGYRVEQREG